MRIVKTSIFVLLSLCWLACSKNDKNDNEPPTTGPLRFNIQSWSAGSVENKKDIKNVSVKPVFRFRFSAPVKKSTVANALTLTKVNASAVPVSINYTNGDSSIIVQPTGNLDYLENYTLNITRFLESTQNVILQEPLQLNLFTHIDSSRKFPNLTEEQLLTKIQQQTFKYFWDYGHPVSGLARERSNATENTIAIGGSGFGIMSMLAGVERGFITRTQALTRLQTIVDFLTTKTKTYKGAFPHWIDGNNGNTIPFSTKDNGADLVETSYLMMGLICAREYFSYADVAETNLRTQINALYQAVDWNWFRRGDQSVLYWHWSEQYGWDMNLPIRGWNECLVTYVLAAASPTHPIPVATYTSGWAQNGAFINGNNYLGYRLPLGPAMGGPLFLSQYSFLGINPKGLKDPWADYEEQTRNHTLINYTYSVNNPMGYYGYSDSVWGLTASDIPNGYTASSPTNDVGVIAPTAALASMPFTPQQSLAAAKFYYYVLGDKIWKDYGFADAFSLDKKWVASSHLAIDQGPIIVMIENHRTGLLWDLFVNAPEIKATMKNLGFTAPYL